MSLLNQVQIDDGQHAFGDTDVFAESMVYTKVATGATRTISGVVDRQPAEQLGEGGVYVPRMTIDLPNNTTNGIIPTEIDDGGDTITVSWKEGGTADVYEIGAILSQDAGMIRIALR